MRISAVIAVAIELKVEVEVEVLRLGTWGCGVFGNDPWDIAKLSREVINQPL